MTWRPVHPGRIGRDPIEPRDRNVSETWPDARLGLLTEA